MKKIQFLSLLLFTLFSLNSCTLEEDDLIIEPDELSTEPFTGQVYGENFNAIGGTSRFVSINGEDVISISLYDVQVNCVNSEDSWIRINVPQQVGVFENGTGLIKDPNSTDFLSLSNIKVEVVSFDSNEVTARVLIDRPSINSSVNGTFTVQFCM